MLANHIHAALDQVRRVQALILEKRKFTGYSGTARLLSGSFAMLGTVVMGLYFKSYTSHLIGWCCILAFALTVNYGALTLWWVQLPDREHTLRNLSPALDAVPPLAVGAILSIALVLKGFPDLLFGSWMCLYGLAHTACGPSLPKKNRYLGFYYLICGTFFLLWPGTRFMSPVPAGAIFLAGEWIGGLIFHRHKVEAMEEYDE